ncbi:alpha/beta fold hydrolase [Glutamicibacter halophytocola]|uniref:alpha/beta hydrolase n=1 Tax=Glutamicibacter halophytocola TaxID=1933880 RepID=UPI003219B6C8
MNNEARNSSGHSLPKGSAVLLIHGFTGSPTAMEPWARSLQGAGFTTAVPLLPGHGTRWQDMIPVGYSEWIQATEQAFDDLARTHGTVFVAGLSMGGALALHLATRRNVAGISLVNPGLLVDSALAPMTPWLKHLMRSVAPISNDIAKRGVDEGGLSAHPRGRGSSAPRAVRANPFTAGTRHRSGTAVQIDRRQCGVRSFRAGAGSRAQARNTGRTPHAASLQTRCNTGL